jgi:hypothetical protein
MNPAGRARTHELCPGVNTSLKPQCLSRESRTSKLLLNPETLPE